MVKHYIIECHLEHEDGRETAPSYAEAVRIGRALLNKKEADLVRVYPLVICDNCGEEIICDQLVNTCECGADYCLPTATLYPGPVYTEKWTVIQYGEHDFSPCREIWEGDTCLSSETFGKYPSKGAARCAFKACSKMVEKRGDLL